jgi:uncharacterized iron-regulated membrane protein
MSAWQKWLRQPQNLLPRKALFQVHLWVGASLALYVVMISVSGSLLVYRRELSAALARGPVRVSPRDRTLTIEQLKEVARLAYPGYQAQEVFTPRNADQAVEVLLRRGDRTIQRLFDPFTGADLGAPEQPAYRFLEWVADLHDNLLAGSSGRLVNGAGATLATLLGLTGAILWWPGIRNWRRSLTIDWKRRHRRLNWSLHSAIGFWMLAFILMWGISGIYLSVPQPFGTLVDYLQPPNETEPATRTGDTVLFWLARLHFGRFAGLGVKALWTILGLAPAVLAVTGVLMWWNRVIRRRPRGTE